MRHRGVGDSSLFRSGASRGRSPNHPPHLNGDGAGAGRLPAPAADAQAIGLRRQRVPVLAFVNNHFASYSPETVRQLGALTG